MISHWVVQWLIVVKKYMRMTYVKSHKMFKYILFADDINLLCDRDLNELVRMINGGLEPLQTWFSVNRLSLNISKTNYMIFGNRRVTADICVIINKEKINRVNSTKCLGVVIDCKLNWKSDILSVRSNCQNAVLLCIEPVP